MKFSLIEIETYVSMRFVFCTDIEILPIIERRYDKSIGEKQINFEISGKPNVNIFVIAVSIWRKHQFKTIFTSNGVMNIRCGIDKVFGSRERAYSMVVNDYFVL